MRVGIISGGFWESKIPAKTKPQFAKGPQKCEVRGPTGEFKKAINLSVIVFNYYNKFRLLIKSNFFNNQ